jgi:hypothetical protein
MGWAIRLIGGIIAPVEWFPVKLSISIHDRDNQREVALRVDENFGFGSLLGVEKKMRGHCDDVGSQFVMLQMKLEKPGLPDRESGTGETHHGTN